MLPIYLWMWGLPPTGDLTSNSHRDLSAPPPLFEAGFYVASPSSDLPRMILSFYLVLQPPTSKCSVPCLGISSCGDGVTLAPCIGFLFSNKPSFIVVILTIVPFHLDFLCSSNQAQMELKRKLGKANWFLAVKLILVLEAES